MAAGSEVGQASAPYEAYEAFEKAVLDCSLGPDFLADLSKRAEDLAAAFQVQLLRKCIHPQVPEEGTPGYLEHFIDILGERLPSLLTRSLLIGLPLEAVQQVLEVLSGLYGLLALTGGYTPAGLEIKSRVNAGILPVLPLLPKELEQCQLSHQVLASFSLVPWQKARRPLLACLAEYPEVLCWAIPRLLSKVMETLPTLEDISRLPEVDIHEPFGPCPIRARDDVALVASYCLALLKALVDACAWDFDSLPGALEGAKEALEAYSQATHMLSAVEVRLTRPSLECWLANVAQLAAILMSACPAAPAAAPAENTGPLGAFARQVASLVWAELHRTADRAARLIGSNFFGAARLLEYLAQRRQDVADLQFMDAAAGAPEVLSLLVRQLGLAAAAAAAIGQPAGGAADTSGGAQQPWDFVTPMQAACVVNLSAILRELQPAAGLRLTDVMQQAVLPEEQQAAAAGAAEAAALEAYARSAEAQGGLLPDWAASALALNASIINGMAARRAPERHETVELGSVHQDPRFQQLAARLEVEGPGPWPVLPAAAVQRQVRGAPPSLQEETRASEHLGGSSCMAPRQQQLQQQQAAAADLSAEGLRLHYAQAMAAAAAAGAGIEAPKGLEALDKLPLKQAVKAVAAGLGLGASSLLDVQEADTCTRQASRDSRVPAAAGPGVTAGAAAAAAFATGADSWSNLSSISESVEAVAQSPTKLGPGISPDLRGDPRAQLALRLPGEDPGDPPALSTPAHEQEARDGPPAADDEQARASEQQRSRSRRGGRRQQQQQPGAELSAEEWRQREEEAQTAADALLREEEDRAARKRAAEEAKAAKQRAKRERQRQLRLAQQAQPGQQQQAEQETEVEVGEEKEEQAEAQVDLYEHVGSHGAKPAQPQAAPEPATDQQQQPTIISPQKQRRRQRRRQQQQQQDGGGPEGAANPGDRPGPQAPQEALFSSDAGISIAREAGQGVQPIQEEAGEDEEAELSLLLRSMGIATSPALVQAEPRTLAQEQRGQEEQQRFSSPQRQPVPPAPAAPATPEAAQPVSLLPGTAPPEHPAAAAGNGSALQLEDDSCVVCMEGPKESVFFPCGHQALCQRCTLELFKKRGKSGERECPICRVAVTQYLLQVFRC